MNENILDPVIVKFVRETFGQDAMMFNVRGRSASEESDIIEVEYEVIDDE